jgi:hypothetical protein
MPEDETIARQLEDLLTPAVAAQQGYYRQLGLRSRILNLPLMVAAVLTLLWRDVAGVGELTRRLAREDFLYCQHSGWRGIRHEQLMLVDYRLPNFC